VNVMWCSCNGVKLFQEGLSTKELAGVFAEESDDNDQAFHGFSESEMGHLHTCTVRMTPTEGC